MNYAKALKATTTTTTTTTTAPIAKPAITSIMTTVATPIAMPTSVFTTITSGTTLVSTTASSTTIMRPIEKKTPEKPIAVVASLHLHSKLHNKAMQPVPKMLLVAGKGIFGNTRYYDRKNITTGYQNRNHVSIIERELIQEHSESLGVEIIAPGLVRSNIETTGIELLDFLNCNVKIGEQAVVFFYKARVSCKQMDDVHVGLDRLMRNARQGVIAEIVKGGEIKIGDEITYCNEDID